MRLERLIASCELRFSNKRPMLFFSIDGFRILICEHSHCTLANKIKKSIKGIVRITYDGWGRLIYLHTLRQKRALGEQSWRMRKTLGIRIVYDIRRRQWKDGRVVISNTDM